ncbi:uncharacterized protein akna isoform X2 [Genypterus blacodes]|uniref:uncharacterized protein akna isoform X2 n=1 Tax=Genypterus blacodes TaxID=154954 RepID=UPI003F770FF8
MGTRSRSTTAGWSFWTPAPRRSSPSSSEEEWEDEEEHKAENEEEFLSQMDENGIIGLKEALEGLNLRRPPCDPAGPEEDRLLGGPTLDPSQWAEGQEEEERWTRSYSAKESDSRPSSRAPSLPLLLRVSAGDGADAPLVAAESFPEVVVTGSRHVSRVPDCHGPHASETESRKHQASSTWHSPVPLSGGPAGGSGQPAHPHRRPDPSPRTRRQNSPEATYSRTRSLGKNKAGSSKPNHRPTCPETEQRGPAETPSRTRPPGAETDGSSSRKGPPSHRTPDFSSVEPRVHFPKSGYRPPKSRRSSMDSSSAKLPLVFKSPADIVKEVLLRGGNGAPPTSDPCRPPAGGPDSTVPKDFRCPRQATTLVEQLQEDYNRLLTKYAEAENTIDRLRLEAKVQLYSDPPLPTHSVQSAVKQEGSKVMMLNFPQAQRADIVSSCLSPNALGTNQKDSSARPSSSTSSSSRRSLCSQVGQQLTKTLCRQADRFLQQLQTFEDLLKSGKLKALDQMKGFSRLVEGLDALETGYLMMRDQHRLLQHPEEENSCFDPDRELEELIFQCGMYVEELKEQMQDQQPACETPPTCEAPPSPLLHPLPVSPPAEGGEPKPGSEISPLPVRSGGGGGGGGGGGALGFDLSSAGEETQDDDTLSSLCLTENNQEHKVQMDCCQSSEPPSLLDQSVREGGGKVLKHQGTGNMELHNFVPHRRADCPPPASASNPPSPSKRFPGAPSLLPVRAKYHSSSLTSLGDSAASERRSSKLQPGCRRALSQDGIVSPETDSGFIGSESSRQTPAAAPLPLHQRATESVSAPQKGLSPLPHASSSSSSSWHRRTSLEQSSDSLLSHPAAKPGQVRRGRKGEGRGASASSSSSRHRPTHTGTRECEPDSHRTHCDSLLSLPRPSPAAPHHHDDPRGAPLSSPVPDHNEAMKRLLVEVSRLQERLESSLRNGDLPTAAPPHSRSEERWREGSWCKRRRETEEEEERWRQRPADRKRSAHRHKDSSPPTDSEAETLKPQLRHRHTQTPPGRSRRRSSRTSPSGQRPGTDEPDTGSVTSACPQCRSSQGTSGGARETNARPPPLCGHSAGSESACRRSRQRTERSPERAARGRHQAALPTATLLGGVPLLQCVPVCPPPLLLYSPPVMASPSGVRGHSPSADDQRVLNKSLKRAIRAATNMKHTSKHMARSLATGLQHQELLNQTWIY